MVEHFLGKEEVTGSIPVNGSIYFIRMGISSLLAHPLMRGLDIDDPRTTDLRRKVIASNGFLRAIYDEWYALLVERVPAGAGHVLEIGSAAGILAGRVPQLIRSEILQLPGLDAVLDAHVLPFADQSLKAIVMVDVLHHLPQPRQFFAEAQRCLMPGGVVVMIEPWVSWWSRLIYGHLHHEPFQPAAADWTFPAGGPLSGANGALPWIIFERDRHSFDREFPGLSVAEIRTMMPFRYLVSGGVSMRQLMPAWTFSVWRALDRLFSAWPMFALVHLRKT